MQLVSRLGPLDQIQGPFSNDISMVQYIHARSMKKIVLPPYSRQVVEIEGSHSKVCLCFINTTCISHSFFLA